MAKYHINPKTGNPGKCTAEIKCRFGGDEIHYPSAENARAAYELSMAPVMKEKLAAADAEREEQDRLEEEAAAGYTELMNSGGQADDDFKSIMETPTVEDIAEGVESAMRHLRNTQNAKWGFKAVMGDVRRTEKQVREYEKKLRVEVGRDPELRAYALKTATNNAKRKAWGRAFERNVAVDPIVDSHFTDIWEGKSRGKSQAELLEEAEETQALRDGLRRGTVTPRTIVGSGLVNPKKAAEEYLDNRLIQLGQSLKTKGRSEPVNISNALFNAARGGAK